MRTIELRSCGAGAPGRKGFQPGNTCGGGGKKKGALKASDHPLPFANPAAFSVPYTANLKANDSARRKALKKSEKLQAAADDLAKQRDEKRKSVHRLRGLYKAHLQKGNKEAARRLAERHDRESDELHELKRRSFDAQNSANMQFRQAIEVSADRQKAMTHTYDSAINGSDRYKLDMARTDLERLLDKSVHENTTVRFMHDTKNRAYAKGNQIFQQHVDQATTFHEYGHVLEDTNPGIKKATQAFLQKRAGKDTPVSMRERYGESFKADEIGRKDDFDKVFEPRRAHYVGKTYKDGGSEVISMGLEAMYSHPAKFAKNDPEYFNFMLGVMRGQYK